MSVVGLLLLLLLFFRFEDEQLKIHFVVLDDVAGLMSRAGITKYILI